MLNYEIVKLKNNLNTLDLDLLDNINNIFAVGVNTISNLEIVDLPIKNKRIGIKQVLTLIKYIDEQSKLYDRDDILIDQNKLIEIFSQNTYSSFMKLLNNINIVKAVKYPDGSYYNMKTGLSKKYRLTEDNEDICLVIINDKKEIQYDIKGKYDKRFINTIKNVEIDIKSAIEEEIKEMKSNNSLRTRLNTIFSLYDRRYIKKGTKVDRVYHSLSNLSKISRKHISIKGMKFSNIDVVNCQPSLLAYLLKKEKMNYDQEYIIDTQLGQFYEKFIIDGHKYIDVEYIKKDGKIVGKNNNIVEIKYNNDKEYKLLRDQIKVMLYKNIFFDFKPKSDIAIKFKELYPSVFSTLEELNKCEIKMAGRLQNIEAEIFNNINPKRSKYFFTLFDAIFFTSIEDAGELMLDIQNKFNEIGLVIKLELERFQPEPEKKEYLFEEEISEDNFLNEPSIIKEKIVQPEEVKREITYNYKGFKEVTITITKEDILDFKIMIDKIKQLDFDISIGTLEKFNYFGYNKYKMDYMMNKKLLLNYNE